MQWAFDCIGPLPWLRTGDRDLSFDRGLTANLRRRPHVGWADAEACAGVTYKGRPIVANRVPPQDAAKVIEAVKRLPPKQEALVIENARLKRRPDPLLGSEGLAAVRFYADPLRTRAKVTRCNGKQGRNSRYVPPFCPIEWAPTWKAICAARADYALWHAGVEALAADVADSLTDWQINGFAAPAPAANWL